VSEYEGILEQRDVKGATQRAYKQTLDLARDTLGHVNLRAIGFRDLDRFVAGIKGHSDAIKAKHLRQLSTCLATAVDYGYLGVNPVTQYKKRLRLRVPKGTPPFTDDEIKRLLAAMASEEKVYVAIVKAALVTGCRIGELAALTWDNVSLGGKRIEVRHTFDQVDGVVDPKDGEPRTVYLTPVAIALLEDWTRHTGAQASGLVFPAPRAKAHLNAEYLRKVVAAAMTTASIPSIDERSGRPRKPLHSLRATYTRQQLEAGRNPQWVQARLGHSDLGLTIGVYGAWTDSAMLAEAARTADPAVAD
jgi:integrase